MYIGNASIRQRFDHLFTVISGRRFLEKQSLGGEVPFFICPFKPEETTDMQLMQKQLAQKLLDHNVKVLEVNLYSLSIDLLKERGIWDQILEMEPSVSKDELKELLQGVLDPETYLAPAIAQCLAQHQPDVFFLSGIGEVFPYIRSHNVLNNLQTTAGDTPTLIFFPGGYTHSLESGASLDLFLRLHDDKYYRAFDIFNCEP